MTEILPEEPASPVTAAKQSEPVEGITPRVLMLVQGIALRFLFVLVIGEFVSVIFAMGP